MNQHRFNAANLFASLNVLAEKLKLSVNIFVFKKNSTNEMFYQQIDNDDNLNENGYRNFVNDLPLDDDQRAEAEQVVTKCIDEIKIFPKIDPASGCNRVTTDAIICVEKVFHVLAQRDESNRNRKF